MGEDVKIANLRGEVYKFIKQGYFGGAVDVYKPSGKMFFNMMLIHYMLSL